MAVWPAGWYNRGRVVNNMLESANSDSDSPVKLHHFNPNIPDICFKCKHEKGTLFHCMWECTKVNCFWVKILNIISQRCISKAIPLDPKLCILHVCPLNSKITKHERLLLILCLLEAKHVIACTWKKDKSPGVSQWIKGMTSYLALEKITYFLINTLHTLWSIWKVLYFWRV